jgi:hypothetical protein
MSSDHERFRASLPGFLLELLPDADQAWNEAHAAACSECAALLSRMRSRLSELQDEVGHVPVRVLEAYALGVDSLTTLERELVRRHLNDCAACREDAEELSRITGVPPISPKRVSLRIAHGRALTAGLVAAAALAVVFSVRLIAWRAPSAPARQPSPSVGPAQQPIATALPPHAEQPHHIDELIVFREPLRGSNDAAVVEAGIPKRGSGVRLRVPRLFLSEDEQVLVRLVRDDGSPVWAKVLGAGALEDDLEPPTPSSGWAAGTYRLEIIPRAGADTVAKRIFSFALVRTRGGTK